MFAGVPTACSPRMLCAQDPAPRAYIIGSIHSNAANLTYSFNNGGILFNNALPITDASATLNISVFGFYDSLSD
jgi:hypothetical protein